MDHHQTTEAADQGPSAGRVESGLLRKPIARSVTIPLALVFAVALLLLFLHRGELHVYQKHLSEPLPETTVPWGALSPQMDEAALRGRFPGLPLRCVNEATPMGERVCYAALRRADSYPALTLALFLRKGRLSLATVHVPWWAHGRAVETLQRQLGDSGKARAGGSVALRRWKVTGGFVDMNERRSLDPLAWSAIVWTPEGTQ